MAKSIGWMKSIENQPKNRTTFCTHGTNARLAHQIQREKGGKRMIARKSIEKVETMFSV
ncbi:hypothetical protein [Candidatus Cardinium sp. cBcalN2]|uniref:hypothetical protein n=1 Tax=Candidatus Cardinium sp. cBcalN2 TaxID=2699436 RepID=UPI001FB203FE|nr:hypothetical protein [Candidatus Cardinium sp. cBcalN2]